MKKKEFILNILFSLIFTLFIIINKVTMNNNCTLVFKILLDLLVGVFFVIFSFIRLKSFKNMYRNIYFIYGLFFFIYSIIGCVIFVLDNYSPRFYYFKINEGILVQTLAIYINVFCIYNIFICIFNRIKIIDFDKALNKNGNSNIISNNMIIFFDIIAIVMALWNLYKILKCGSSFFSLSTSSKRLIIDSGVSHYINLFMIVYSLYISLIYITKKGGYKNKLSIFSIVIYWLVTLTCERRMFVTFLIGFIFIMLYKFEKIGFKKLIIIVLTFILLLFSAAIRDNVKFSNHKFIDVLYSSATEFYCTFMISDAYVYDKHELEYGKTYIVDSLSKLLPQAILTNKSEDLSFKFKKEYNTNVGFAFNPVAEGILNFGNFAPIMVAIIMFLICLFALAISKKNILYYIILLTFSLDFCRGAFSNVFFDTIFCYVLIFVLSRVCIKKDAR